MMKSKKTVNQICVLCGVNPASSGQGDHIPPKSIYTPEERTGKRFDFHTVPACIKCNNTGNLADESLKIMINLGTGPRRDNPDDVIENIAKTLDKNNRLKRQIFSSAQQVIVQNRMGAYEEKVSVTFDESLYVKAMERIARAMHWKITGEILSLDTSVQIIVDGEHSHYLMTLAMQGDNKRSVEVNGGTFKCELIELGLMKIMKIIFFNSQFAIALI